MFASACADGGAVVIVDQSARVLVLCALVRSRGWVAREYSPLLLRIWALGRTAGKHHSFRCQPSPPSHWVQLVDTITMIATATTNTRMRHVEFEDLIPLDLLDRTHGSVFLLCQAVTWTGHLATTFYAAVTEMIMCTGVRLIETPLVRTSAFECATPC